MALTHYAVLYGKSPVGLPHELKRADGSPATAPSPELARRMQEIVWEVVTRIPRPVCRPRGLLAPHQNRCASSMARRQKPSRSTPGAQPSNSLGLRLSKAERCPRDFQSAREAALAPFLRNA